MGNSYFCHPDHLTYKYEQDVAGINFKNQRVYMQNDPQGNLISDKSEEIASIEWTAA